MAMVKRIFVVGVVSMSALTTFAQTRAGAVVQGVDKNGNPVTAPIVVPDCRTCTVKQTGPNSYEVKVPNDVRAKVGMPPAKTTPTPTPTPNATK